MVERRKAIEPSGQGSVFSMHGVRSQRTNVIVHSLLDRKEGVHMNYYKYNEKEQQGIAHPVEAN